MMMVMTMKIGKKTAGTGMTGKISLMILRLPNSPTKSASKTHPSDAVRPVVVAAEAVVVGARPRVALRLRTLTTPTPAATTRCATVALVAVAPDPLLAVALVVAVRGVAADADLVAGSVQLRLAAPYQVLHT